MRIFKTILVGMILAVAIIPLPGHTAATGPQAPDSAPGSALSASAPQPAAPQTPAPPAASDANTPRTPTSPAAGGTAAPGGQPQTTAPEGGGPTTPAPAPTASSTTPPAPAAPAPATPAAPETKGAPTQASASAAPKPIEVVKNGDTKLKLNFQDATVQTIMEYLSETMGLVIQTDQPIGTSRITVITRQPITLDHALGVINSMLKDKGLVAVLREKTLRVIPFDKAKVDADTQVRIVRDPNQVEKTDNVCTYIIPVSHVTAAGLAQNLQALLPENTQLTANIDGNALIITDTSANVRRMMQIVQALDTHLATVAEIKVWRLNNADATSTAQLINTIFQQQAQSPGMMGGRGFPGRGGFMSGGPMQMMMRMAGAARAFGGRGGQGGPTPQGGGNVNVAIIAAADSQTNSVVVRGPKESIELVNDIIKALDDTNARVATVRVFQLRYADAMNTADIINQLFNPQSSTSSRGGSRRGGFGGPGGGMMGPIMFQPFGGPGGGPGGQSGAYTAVQVTAAADSRTNTVVVTGPEQVLTTVDDVVKKLDQPLSNVADVKVFHLEFADASNSAQLINDVFGQNATSRSSSRSRSSSGMQQGVVTFQRGPMGGMMAGPGGQGSGTSSSDIPVVASADTRTNSVVVSGPPETLKVIEQVIKELDSNPEQERRIFVYPLRNGTATSLMTILNNLFQQMQTYNQRATGSRSTATGGQRNAGAGMASAGGPMGGGATTSSASSGDSLSEETYFQADPNTNSLLVMTSSKNYEKVKPIIAELDKPVGQVLIKVLFAELSHTNNVDWGTEFSMLNLNSNGRVGTVQANGSGLITQGSPVLASPPAGTGTTFPSLGAGAVGYSDGLAIRAIQGDLDVTLHALQVTGKLNVLSRPYILTRNNRMATITVADEVPIPGSSTSSGSIGSTTTYSYRTDIGIVLDVTPSINDDGLVNMVVSPKITTEKGTVQVAAATPTSGAVTALEFATRSASTRVAVQDGQTIVIGGLIQDQSNETIHKVPLLGDIPLIGLLFRRTVVDKQKTELLIFLTPYVAKEPKDLTQISDTEEQRSTLSKDKEGAALYRKHLNAMKSEVLDPNQPQQ